MSMHVAILILVILCLIVNLALIFLVWKVIHQADISKILLEKDKVIETIGGVRSTVDNINNKIANVLQLKNI